MVEKGDSVGTALAFSLVVISAFGLGSPAWFQSDLFSFGLFASCSWPKDNAWNQTCVVYRTLKDIPDPAWKMSAALLLGGWALLVLWALLLLSWTILPGDFCPVKGRVPTQYIQTASVSASLLGLLLFPFSLASQVAQDACGPSSCGLLYSSGQCHVGWGFLISILALVLTSLLSIVGRSQGDKIQEKQILFSSITERIVFISEPKP
ncbi:LOW QUALITY PROTEIN: LHFPL tetraspan subfamily member 7 protein [Monodelphis domestica]|uniref:LOW QUALITY PROTEIN: LHFPL tetraspan subfamily member 7 protein n=1 Tax=Monodelphis domestica TaxID=13616 RepID=UPI0004432813|nr:LOW QUALITY PROTEIN: LHFPL tetraspan subfamily member 7 protein [Monodelphis domestica]